MQDQKRDFKHQDSNTSANIIKNNYEQYERKYSYKLCKFAYNNESNDMIGGLLSARWSREEKFLI